MSENREGNDIHEVDEASVASKRPENDTTGDENVVILAPDTDTAVSGDVVDFGTNEQEDDIGNGHNDVRTTHMETNTPVQDVHLIDEDKSESITEENSDFVGNEKVCVSKEIPKSPQNDDQTEDTLDHVASTKLKDNSPKLPKRNPSLLRASRTHSLIIPVVSPCNDNTTEETRENSIFVNLEKYQGTDIASDDRVQTVEQTSERFVPPLPPRKTPDHLDVTLSRSTSELSDYTNFLPVEDHALDGNKVSDPGVKESLTLQNEKFLLSSRKTQIDYVIQLLSSNNLTISNNEYFERLHSSNSYIEVLSEINAGSFETANLPILYSLIMKSLKVKNIQEISNCKIDPSQEKIITEIIDKLFPLIKSNDDGKRKFKNDVYRVYSVIASIYAENDAARNIKPNALVIAFIYRCANSNILEQAVIFGSLIHEFILMRSKEFNFLLLRAFELTDDKLLILNSDEIQNLNPLSYLISLFGSDDFWCGLVLKLYENDFSKDKKCLGLTKALHNIIIYGVNSLIDVFINLRFDLKIFNCEKSVSKPEIAFTTSNLVRFQREFVILQDTVQSQMMDESLEILASKNKHLKEELQNKKTAYNELIQNFQLINEEKLSVSGIIDKLKAETGDLHSEKRSLNAKLDYYLSRYDVIKQTIDKNRRVKELNNSIRQEITRIKNEMR